jgi:ribonuclease HII
MTPFTPSTPEIYADISRLCGLDEAGRGPLAGPLVAAAVIFPKGFNFAERFPKLPLRDSKKLSARQRQKAAEAISAVAETYLAEISVSEINQQGLAWANKAVFEQLIAQIEAELYIVDGNLRFDPAHLGGRAGQVQCLVRADQTVQSVSAASVIAKVRRDTIMEELAKQHPNYGWLSNRGYGTPAHIAALRAHGPSPHHRQQFVKTALEKEPRF